MERIFTHEIPIAPDTVRGALRSPEFHLARVRDMPTTLSAVVVQACDTAFELHIEGYALDKDGAVRTDRRESAVQRFVWRAGVLSWAWEGEHRKHATVGGTVTVSAHQGASRIESRLTVDVHVPIVGRFIARYVLDKMAESEATLARDLEAALTA